MEQAPSQEFLLKCACARVCHAHARAQVHEKVGRGRGCTDNPEALKLLDQLLVFNSLVCGGGQPTNLLCGQASLTYGARDLVPGASGPHLALNPGL
jgi:hypothetical protein